MCPAPSASAGSIILDNPLERVSLIIVQVCVALTLARALFSVVSNVVLLGDGLREELKGKTLKQQFVMILSLSSSVGGSLR